jgi:hypothetical protein
VRGGSNRSRDLLAACLIAVVCLPVTIAAPGGWVQAIPLLLLVLAVSGYTLSAALFPPAAIDAAERVVYSFVFALSAAALGGLLIHFAVDLDRWAWFALLAAIALGASGIAQRRRLSMPIQRSTAPAELPAGILWAICFLAATAIAAGAVAIAVGGVHEQQGRQRFASLWAIPVGDRVEAGVWNHGSLARYRLDVSSGGRTLQRVKVRLSPGGRWNRMLSPLVSSATSGLLLTLYRDSIPYRSVDLDISGSR